MPGGALRRSILHLCRRSNANGCMIRADYSAACFMSLLIAASTFGGDIGSA
jgi:hypothetical protein